MRKDITKSGRRKRIVLIFNHPFWLGGGEISFAELIRSINRERFVPVIVVPKEGEIADIFINQNLDVCVSPFPSLKRIVFGSPILAVIKLARFFKTNKIDIIHANGSRACLYAGVAGLITGIPVIWHVRETIRDIFFYDGFLALLARKVVCVSGSVRDKRFKGFPALIRNRTQVIYNGVDTLKFKRDRVARERFRNDLNMGDGILFGMVGNIIPRKAQDFFLRGLALAKERKPDLPARLLIIGRSLDTNFKKMLCQLVTEMNLCENVILSGYSKEMVEVFSALDVFVLCSKSEGFSRALIEAMSMGLPVLATKISEIEEAVVEGENAFLVNTDDEDAMAAAIIRFSEDAEIRKDMGERNRARAVENVDLKRHAESVEMIYDGVLYRKS